MEPTIRLEQGEDFARATMEYAPDALDEMARRWSEHIEDIEVQAILARMGYVKQSVGQAQGGYQMTAKVKVKTNNDDYALLGHERAEIEFEKDGDSPACPNSWTWCAFFDGQLVEGCCEEQSFAASVKDAAESIASVIDELTAIRDYLTAFGAFCREPEVSE